MPEQMRSTLRHHFTHDRHRPRYHFLPPSNWMNDPNGLIQWNGMYHLFYQHNPYGPLWGNMSWGHAVSEDLIHWQDLPVALSPTPNSPDESGCFSGCAVDDDGTPTIIYTAVRGDHHEIQTQSIAVSYDNLMTWQKHPSNPVIAEVPPELGQTRDFRDPFVWKEGHTWYMALASRIQNAQNAVGVVLLYRSANLIDWEYLNPLLEGEPGKHGVLWECPNLFKSGDKWLLIVSAYLESSKSTVLYFVGEYKDFRFHPESSGVLDYGDLYAPLTFADGQGRRLLFGWLRESRPDADQERAGWSGVQSIPRVLSLDAQQRLLMKPVPVLEALRTRHYTIHARPLTENIPLDVRGLQLDIEAQFAPGKAGICGFSFAFSDSDHEQVDILYDSNRQHLMVRKWHPEATGAATSTLEAEHHLAPDEPLHLRILLDGSVIETVANDRTSITSRYYPTSSDSAGVTLIAQDCTLESLDVWEMASIWS